MHTLGFFNIASFQFLKSFLVTLCTSKIYLPQEVSTVDASSSVSSPFVVNP